MFKLIKDVVLPLWPLYVAIFGLCTWGVIAIVRIELEKKLINKDGPVYTPSKEFEKGMLGINREVMRIRVEIKENCAEHRDACQNNVCLKINDVLKGQDIISDQLLTMNMQREQARVERKTDREADRQKIDGIATNVATLTGRFNEFQKKLT